MKLKWETDRNKRHVTQEPDTPQRIPSLRGWRFSTGPRKEWKFSGLTKTAYNENDTTHTWETMTHVDKLRHHLHEFRKGNPKCMATSGRRECGTSKVTKQTMGVCLVTAAEETMHATVSSSQ